MDIFEDLQAKRNRKAEHERLAKLGDLALKAATHINSMNGLTGADLHIEVTLTRGRGYTDSELTERYLNAVVGRAMADQVAKEAISDISSDLSKIDPDFDAVAQPEPPPPPGSFAYAVDGMISRGEIWRRKAWKNAISLSHQGDQWVWSKHNDAFKLMPEDVAATDWEKVS